MKKKYLIPLIVIPGLILGLLAGFLVWTQIYYKPTDRALAYLDSDENVNVEVEKNIEFTPKHDLKNKGFIFYPGGKVDEKAYSYLGYDLAREGYTVVIAKMPLRLAIFNTGVAADIIDENDTIDSWIIGGHSLGGSAASIFTADNPGAIDGLVFLASYPANSSDLSATSIPVLSMTGSRDGIINAEALAGAEKLLPDRTIFLDIEGGNHSQFGDYGLQSGDHPADIDILTQHELVIQGIFELFESLN